MKKQSIIVSCVVVLLLLGGAFYGGMRYDRVKIPLPSGGFASMANLSQEERQTRMQQFGVNVNGAARQRGAQAGGGGFTNGEIIAKDDQSVTLKLVDGGSKIIFFSGETKVTKSVDGTMEDVKMGANVMAIGSANQDGSITAQTIQIRPAGLVPVGLPNGSANQ